MNNNNNENELMEIENITTITGLYDLDILKSDMFDLRFFLMSDMHTTFEFNNPENNSLYLPVYLDTLFKKNKDKQFDLLMEIPPLKKSPEFKKSNSGIFISMYRQFKNCFSSIDGGKLCSEEWPNVRFHNVDIRQIHHDLGENNFDFPLLRLTREIYDLTKELRFGKLVREISSDEGYKTKFTELLNLVMDLSKKKRFKSMGEYFISEIYKSEKYAGYKNLEYFDEINANIKNHIDTHTLIYDIFEKCKLLQKKGDKINEYEMRRFVGKCNVLFRNLRSAIMDLYTLLRILRIRSYGGKNIFVLAGANHIKTIKSVIESIDFYSSDYIKGSPLIDDTVYMSFCNLVKRRTIRVPIDPFKIKIRPEQILELIRKYTDHHADESELERVENLNIIITDIKVDRESRETRIITKHPEEQLTRIQYSLIRDNLF